MSLPCHPYSTFTRMETLTCIVFADQFNWKKVRTNPDGTMVLYPYPDDSRATLNYSGKGKNQYLESLEAVHSTSGWELIDARDYKAKTPRYIVPQFRTGDKWYAVADSPY